MSLNDIVEALKRFKDRLFNNTPQLLENASTRSTYSRVTPSQWKDDYKVDNNKTSRTPNQLQYRSKTRRQELLELQEKNRRSESRKKIASIVASIAIASTCISACVTGLNKENTNYNSMSIDEIELCLDDEDISKEDLSEISDILSKQGLNSIKEKVAYVLDISEEFKDHIIVYSSEPNFPTTISTSKGAFRSIDGIVDPDRAYILSDGIAAVADSTGFIQNNPNITSSALSQYIAQLEELDKSSFILTDNDISGKILSSDNEEELIRLSVTNHHQKDDIQQSDDYEIG